MKYIQNKLRHIERKCNLKNHSTNRTGNKFATIASACSLATVIIMAITYYTQFVRENYDVSVGISHMNMVRDTIFAPIHFSNQGNRSVTINYCKFYFVPEEVDKLSVKYASYMTWQNIYDGIENNFVLPPDHNGIFRINQKFDHEDISGLFDFKDRVHNDSVIEYETFNTYLLTEYYIGSDLVHHIKKIGKIQFTYDDSVRLSQTYKYSGYISSIDAQLQSYSLTGREKNNTVKMMVKE